MQGPQHDDPSWDARQLPSRVILSGTRKPGLSSEPCNKAPSCLRSSCRQASARRMSTAGSLRSITHPCGTQCGNDGRGSTNVTPDRTNSCSTGTTNWHQQSPKTKTDADRTVCKPAPISHFRVIRDVMGQGGIEPPTSRLSGVRSNQLSYWPKQKNIM